jgi:hypothetical protein
MTKARDIASATTPNANAALLATFPHRNLIINGAMQVAQRGTSGTSTADIYTVDRFALGHGSPVNAMTFEQSTDTPDNFKNSLKITAGTGASASTTGYAILRQAIEGQNIAHLGFGTSAAKAITLSFHVKSSLTGTFGISIRNQAGNRAYAGTYVINSANTWEYKTVAIPADTSGTWPTDTGIGFHLFWDLGAGSNYDIAAGSWTSGSNMFGVESTVKLTETTNATFFITGIQLELGSTATPFEHRSFGDELLRCQRYYCRSYNIGTDTGTNTLDGAITTRQGGTPSTNNVAFNVDFPVTMRSAPTMTLYAKDGTSGQVSDFGNSYSGDGTDRAVNAVNAIGMRGFGGGNFSGVSENDIVIFHYEASSEL